MLAANYEFDPLLEHVAGFLTEPFAEAFDFIVPQSNPDFTDLLDYRESAQCMNQDRNSGQFCKLLRRMSGIFCRHGSHTRSQTCGGNDYKHLHRGLSVYEGRTGSSNAAASSKKAKTEKHRGFSAFVSWLRSGCGG